ncbi:MAG: nitrophenyl compound nitroreductase subunit ArsF family protein, partial [Planctomycetota bacterium]|nr:nitrophenyl compound nitroreductase subunit ArsF family protein [Planctomycetota bacterium]
MTAKAIISKLLIAFVLVTIGFALGRETGRTSPVPSDSAAPPAGPAVGHKVIAYYFYTNVRCATCRKIEAYTQEAVTGLAAATKDVAVEWRAVNTDDAANEHFKADYSLVAKSVIVADWHDGKQTQWKNLDKIWELVDDQAAFQK